MAGYTKADVLKHRLIEARLKVEKLEAEIRGLQLTQCGLTCGGCGTVHETEWDFAKHYVLGDIRYLNLGSCPVKDSRTHTIDLAREMEK